MVNVSKQFMNDLFSIKDKVAIVTGATGALGSAIAVGYALAGAKVVLTARHLGKIEEVAAQIRNEGGTCACVAGDPSNEEDVKNIVKFAVDTFGEVNILAACHGFNKTASILDQSVQDWQKIMDANVTSMYLLCKFVGEQMVKQGKGGKMVITSSARSKMGMKNYTGYSSSKGACDLLIQSVGCDLGQYNIQVNTFNPTVFRSELTEWMWGDEAVYQNFLKRIPVGRLGEPYDFVGMAIMLASHASDFFTSSNYAADGGYWGN
jgi:NAD(P)-dependent dehydrogenase (short-subunit alcohol dehydrogenase family)